MNEPDLEFNKIDIQSFEKLLSQLKEKSPLTMYEGITFVNRLNTFIEKLPTPFSLDISQNVNVIDDFYENYRKIYSMAKKLLIRV